LAARSATTIPDSSGLHSGARNITARIHSKVLSGYLRLAHRLQVWPEQSVAIGSDSITDRGSFHRTAGWISYENYWRVSPSNRGFRLASKAAFEMTSDGCDDWHPKSHKDSIALPDTASAGAGLASSAGWLRCHCCCLISGWVEAPVG